jgi:hypothetical protein
MIIRNIGVRLNHFNIRSKFNISLPLPPMQFFAYILSVYLLLLSCYPCRDGDGDRYVNEKNTSITAFVNTTSGQHQQKNKPCTPFCACSHCPASAFFQPVSPFKALPPTRHLMSFYYLVPLQSYDFNAVWQPPRIG